MDNYYRKFTDDQMLDIQDAVAQILKTIRGPAWFKNESLQETPKRVAKMYEELLQGEQYTNAEIANLFNKTFPINNDDLILAKNIEAFSLCEHHMALMYNMKVHVAYIPNGKVIGLSKIPRIVELVTRRLQLQERIGKDIADIMHRITGSPDQMVIIEAAHACVTTRGVRQRGASTKTATILGRFEINQALRKEVYDLLKGD